MEVETLPSFDLSYHRDTTAGGHGLRRNSLTFELRIFCYGLVVDCADRCRHKQVWRKQDAMSSVSSAFILFTVEA